MPSRQPRIYIDSCYYIDVVKGRRSGTLDPDRQAHISVVERLLQRALDGHIEIWASTLVVAECLSIGRDADVPESVRAEFEGLLTAGKPVKIHGVDLFVVERARDLRWVHGINCGGGADGIHVATALELGCREFLTANRRRGPLNVAPELEQLGLRVITAPEIAWQDLPRHVFGTGIRRIVVE